MLFMLKDKEKGLEKVLLETEEKEDVEAAALLQREQVISFVKLIINTCLFVIFSLNFPHDLSSVDLFMFNFIKNWD